MADSSKSSVDKQDTLLLAGRRAWIRLVVRVVTLLRH